MNTQQQKFLVRSENDGIIFQPIKDTPGTKDVDRTWVLKLTSILKGNQGAKTASEAFKLVSAKGELFVNLEGAAIQKGTFESTISLEKVFESVKEFMRKNVLGQ